MYDVFNLPDIAFPAGFLWGSATAAHQVEGDNVHSQRWADEQAGRIAVPSGKACDHYRRYRGDVALLARLGHGAYRMSVEWSRIEPENGRWDEAAADHYVDLLERLKNRGIRPFVTLHHVTHPLWFEKLGGFAGRGNLRYFERFLERLVPRLSPFTDGWIVLNEFNLSTAPDSGPLKLAMLRAHARGYHIIKRHSKAPVGTAHAYIHWLPARCHDPLDRVLARYR